MADSVPDVKLSNGLQMPTLGFGTSLGLGACDEAVLVEAVRRAIDTGYRAIDTALVCHTEPGVGRAINQKIAEAAVTRGQLFVISKLWCTAHRRRDVIPALSRTLASMGLAYLDLYLVHFPVTLKSSEDSLFPKDEKGDVIFADEDVDLTETWQGMEDALSAGLTKAIGLSNFNQKQIERILAKCRVKPMSLHIESNPYFLNSSLIDYCSGQGIPVTVYSPLGNPSRTWQNTPGDPYIATDPVLVKIGSKYGKTPHQVALRFHIQRGVSVLAKTFTPSRMTENMQIFDFQLSDEDMMQITALDRNFRIIWMDIFRPSREYPFVDE